MFDDVWIVLEMMSACSGSVRQYCRSIGIGRSVEGMREHAGQDHHIYGYSSKHDLADAPFRPRIVWNGNYEKYVPSQSGLAPEVRDRCISSQNSIDQERW